MAEQKFANRLDQILNKVPARHEPEVEGRQVRDAFDEVRAPKVRGREGITLNVRLADGSCIGYTYAYLTRVKYVPGDTLKLQFVQSEVVIEGRKLRDLYSRLLDHRVEAVQEGTETEEGLKSEEAAHIDSISIIESEERAA